MILPTGFASPSENDIEKNLDLNTFLVKHPASTFFVRVQGGKLRQAGIQSGDMLVVDKSLKPNSKSIVIATEDGEFKMDYFRKLKTAEIWGTATAIIRVLKP